MTMMIADAEHVFTGEGSSNRNESTLCSPSRHTRVLS
jgi:hypothetical protein